MNRAETTANVVAITKRVLIRPTDFVELWVINDLIDDPVHIEMLGERKVTERYSVLRIEHGQFNQLNEPHGIYGSKYLRIQFQDNEMFVNTDAIYKIAAPIDKLEALNSRISGATWIPSSTDGYAILNVSCAEQAKYF